MTLRLVSLCFDANDPPALANFWGGLLGWDIGEEGDGEVALVPADGTRFDILFLPVPEPKLGKNRTHLDLTSTSVEEQQRTVARAVELGARPVQIGQGRDADQVVLGDPEGNEFCVLAPGNFVDNGGFVGSITWDAAGPDVGYFWRDALGWPLVWDQDDETAIRSPDGAGQFITWGPPPVEKLNQKNRLHLDLAPGPDEDQLAEVDRLIALGARRVDIGQGDVSWVVLADPEDNEFCVLTPR